MPASLFNHRHALFACRKLFYSPFLCLECTLDITADLSNFSSLLTQSRMHWETASSVKVGDWEPDTTFLCIFFLHFSIGHLHTGIGVCFTTSRTYTRQQSHEHLADPV